MQQTLFPLLLFLCSKAFLQTNELCDINEAVRLLGKLQVLMQLLCHDLYGCLFLLLIIFALDVALLLIFNCYYSVLIINLLN